jgi:hypothetical protein
MILMGIALCCVAQNASGTPHKKTNSAAGARRSSAVADEGAKPVHSIEEITAWIINNSHISIERRDNPGQFTLDQDLEKGTDDCILLVKTRYWNLYPPGELIRTSEKRDIWTADLRKLSPDYFQAFPHEDKTNVTTYWIQFFATNKAKLLSHSVKSHTTFEGSEDLDESDKFMESIVRIRAPNEDLAQRLAHALTDGIKQCGGKSDAKDIY